MAAFHVPPFVFFVRCGGEAVFFVCSEDQGPVENTRFSRRFAQAECMPFACFFRYCDGYKCVSCAKWKVEREFFGYPGLQNDSTVWYAVSFRLDEKAAFYAVHRLVGSGVFRRQAHAVASA